MEHNFPDIAIVEERFQFLACSLSNTPYGLAMQFQCTKGEKLPGTG
jgi:hypothetical protein